MHQIKMQYHVLCNVTSLFSHLNPSGLSPDPVHHCGIFLANDSVLCQYVLELFQYHINVCVPAFGYRRLYFLSNSEMPFWNEFSFLRHVTSSYKAHQYLLLYVKDEFPIKLVFRYHSW